MWNTLFRRWSAKRKRILHLHCLYNCWFCYENEKEKLKLSADLFRRMQIQNKGKKLTNFIKVQLESVSELELEPDIELELKSDLESDT